MSRYLISVVIPVYNRFDCLRGAIISVLKQTYSNFEIVIVDDGSEEDILSGLKEFDDNRIAYYKLEHGNANIARNYGIKKSKGDFIAMLDSDDLWLENHLYDCVSFMENTKADGLYGSLILRDTQTRTESIINARGLKKNETMIDYLLQLGYGAQTSTLFMTKESATSVLWDSSLATHQDYDFVVRYSKDYTIMPKSYPTVIYIRNDEKKHVDFDSCIRFIGKNKPNINPVLYNDYNLKMLIYAKKRNENKSIIGHYKFEATYYKEYLSFFEYRIIRMAKSKMDLLKNKIEFIIYLCKL